MNRFRWVVFTGRVHRQVVNLAGASRYQAFGEVNVQGAAYARVAVAEVLDVVSGAGSVEYIGSPRAYESVRGAGLIASYKN